MRKSNCLEYAMDEKKANELLGSFLEDPPEVFAGVVATMSEVDKAFFNGYVVGYTKGCSYAQAAIDEDADNDYPNKETTA